MGFKDIIKNIKSGVKTIQGEETKNKIFTSERVFQDRQEALLAFQQSKEKLFQVNNWSDLPGISSGFRVYDANGNIKTSRKAALGDFIFINLPGPTPEVWVKVIDVEEGEHEAEFTVSPSSDPRERGENEAETKHFFTDEATSTFRVELEENTLRAYEIGRNERVNNQGKEAGGHEVMNTLVAVGGWMAIQEMQWQKLTDYLVHKI